MPEDDRSMREWRREADVKKRAALIDSLARTMEPTAHDPDWFDDKDNARDRAEAEMHARAIVDEWLDEHDREVSEAAVLRYQTSMGNALLALLPPNPYKQSPRECVSADKH